MAKTDSKTPQQVKTSVFRVEQALDAAGKPIPGKWNCVEVEITGVITSRKALENSQVLPVCRETWRKKMLERMEWQNPESQPW